MTDKSGDNKRIQKKYEEILAAPESLLIENNVWQRDKTLIEDL